MKRLISTLLILLIAITSFSLQACDTLENISFIELSAEDIYKLASPSVVEIQGKTLRGSTTGTGFFYDQKGTIITNFHVIAGCTEATITLSDGATHKIKQVLGYNAEKDIAILSTSCKDSTPLTLRNTKVETGETIYTIGSSLGLTGSLSDGLVSSSERTINDNTYIQITAPISKGNSGGPLLDSSGKVIGITTACLIDGQNLNLAIPIDAVKQISTNEPVELSTLLLQYIEENPADALGVTKEQLKIAKLITNDSTYYCLNISEIKSKISSNSSNYNLQVDTATEYINALSWDYGQKTIMFKIIFPSDHTYNNDLIDYLNERDDISYEEMEYILQNLGFTIDKNGNIYWN